MTEMRNQGVKGRHCESSAMLNALNARGYAISEEEIIGLSSAPGFVYERTSFPFLGGRSHAMRSSGSAAYPARSWSGMRIRTGTG